ncbi:ATP-binding protein [Chitinibacteraceae bacterium HSL-7]
MIERLARLWPRSLWARLGVVMVAGVLVTQVVANALWAAQLRSQHREEMKTAAGHVAASAASAIRFFKSLPTNYRPLLIEQLREMGGTRFFVTVNDAPVTVAAISNEALVREVAQDVDAALNRELPQLGNYQLAFAWPDTLTVDDYGTRVDDLPDEWVQHTLILSGRPAPVLVIQAELADGNWIYLAAQMPDPYFLDKARLLPPERVSLQLVTLIAVLLFSVLGVRFLTRPLAELAAAAKAFGQGQTVTLPEGGSREYQHAARAFNAMQAQIRRFVSDREQLFAAISHDLRTPITRLKLRAELLDDEEACIEFNEDLDELDLMVKGALQSVKDTAVHEDLTALRLDLLVQRLVSEARLMRTDVNAACAQIMVTAKPLALKRALSNLVDNGVKYGGRVQMLLTDAGDMAELTIRDFGPGVPDDVLERLGRPYMRLEHGKSRNASGMGLGLSIARDIVLAHGGSLELANHPAGGLIVTVRLPKIG